jgi:hypothetical protein
MQNEAQGFFERIPDAFWFPGCELLLILIAGAVAFATGFPLLFASLGPTAYEQSAMPHLKSSRPYNVLVGHTAGLGSAFLALWITHAWSTPAVTGSTSVSAARLWAAVIAVLITSVITVALKARQPAALATTLLVAMGAFQNSRGALAVILGVVLITIIGEPIRRARGRHLSQAEQQQRERLRAA